MNIIFIPESDENSPASYFRLYQLLSYIREKFDVRVILPIIPYRHSKYSFFREKYLLIKNILRIFGALSKSKYNDIIYVQRGIFERGIFEKLVFYVYLLFYKLGRKIIFDFDDAIYLTSPKYVPKMIKISRAVFVGSHHLYEYAFRINRNCYVLPTGVKIPDKPNSYLFKKAPKIILGWIGSETTLKYVSILKEILEELSKDYEIVLSVMCSIKPALEIGGVETEFSPWSRNGEDDFFRGIDIGLMPLFDTEWERGKCGLKLLRYMSYGIPAVGSAVGENRYIVRDGENGFLAKSADDWRERLRQLFDDENLRKKISLNARKFVEENYSVEIVSAKLVKLLYDVSKT